MITISSSSYGVTVEIGSKKAGIIKLDFPAITRNKDRSSPADAPLSTQCAFVGTPAIRIIGLSVSTTAWVISGKPAGFPGYDGTGVSLPGPGNFTELRGANDDAWGQSSNRVHVFHIVVTNWFYITLFSRLGFRLVWIIKGPSQLRGERTRLVVTLVVPRPIQRNQKIFPAFSGKP